MYIYFLNESNLKDMGIEGTNANNYTIEQSSWDGFFHSMYEWKPKTYEKHGGGFFEGEIRGKEIIKGKQLTEKQKRYIIKKCECKEY